MNSGSVINVRLSGEKTASLQEIKPGVTLRVTPRLIPNPGDNRSQDQILLKVYAETSSPMAGINVDGIPQINSQHASTEVTVLQGEPYLVSGLIKDRESMNQSGIPTVAGSSSYWLAFSFRRIYICFGSCPGICHSDPTVTFFETKIA